MQNTSYIVVSKGKYKMSVHLQLKQMRQGDSDSVGTALSLGRREEKSTTANGSTCNLYEDKSIIFIHLITEEIVNNHQRLMRNKEIL